MFWLFFLTQNLIKTFPDPPPTFPPPSGAWARSAGTLAQVWVDRSVQPDCTRFGDIGLHCFVWEGGKGGGGEWGGGHTDQLSTRQHAKSGENR